MNSLLNWMTRVGDKAGFGGALVAAAGCTACFPALAGLGAVVGLGFLSQWEGVLVTWVIPLIAIAVMLINGLGHLQHHRWRRTLPGLIGPALVLLGALTMSELYLYPGLAIMLGVSVWDIMARRSGYCATDTGRQTTTGAADE